MKMYKENYGFNNFNKKILLAIFSVFIFFFVVFLSVGFSAFELELVMKDISAIVRFNEDDVVVHDFKSVTSNNGAVPANTSFNYNRIYGDITLPNSDSSVVYEVQVTNLGNARVGVASLTGLDSSLTYTLTDYVLGEPLEDENGNYKLGTTMKFYITIQYAEGETPVSVVQPFNILLEFKPFHTITYHGVPGEEEFPNEIMEGKDLVLNTELTSIDRLKITQDTAFLTYGEHFFYDSNLKQLTVKNVEGDLLLSYRDISYLTDLSNLTGYFKELTYRTSIENAYFVNHVDIPNDETLKETYDLSENKDESIIGWIVTNDNGKYDLYIGSIYDIYTKNFGSAFRGMTGLKSISFANLNTSESISFAYTFFETGVESLDLSTFNTQSALTMDDMFGNMYNLKSLDVSNFNTRNVESMWYTFGGLTSLTELDISTFDTSSVTNMTYMFSGMTNLKKLNLGPKFNTSNVQNMSYMFHRMLAIEKLDLSTFKTGNVTNMSYMFYNCLALKELDVSTFDTKNVNRMDYMFYGLKGLESLDLSNFNTSVVTNMSYMFATCSSITTLDLTNFNTSSVTTMQNMFHNMTNLTTLYLNNFNLTMTSNMNSFVEKCTNLQLLDLRSANFSNITYTSSMFNDLPESIEIIVANEDTKAWVESRLEAGVGTVIVVTDLEGENPDTGEGGTEGSESGGEGTEGTVPETT